MTSCVIGEQFDTMHQGSHESTCIVLVNGHKALTKVGIALANIEDSNQWIRELVGGNAEVTSEFWSTYAPALQRLADQHMSPVLKRRMDADDVVQSVFRTFFRRARENQFSLDSNDDLWRLLCAVTLTKVRQHARFQFRQRRTPNRESNSGPDDSNPEIQDRRSPSPEEIVEFIDQFQALIADLDEEQRKIVLFRLDGLDNEEIAAQMQCTSRTVRRLVADAREQWDRQLEKFI